MKFKGVYLIEGRPATQNLTPGQNVYGEKLIQEGEVELRLWNPKRSKLAAAIINGLKEMPIKKNSRVLYLGAATGTTASHISDIACEGTVYCVEFSQRSFRELFVNSADRNNMVPILADARNPHSYLHLVEKCDVIYQDVAQVEQAQILIDNAHFYLKDCGCVMIAIKARSINSAKGPKSVIKAEISKLKKYFKILESLDLGPYEKDHEMTIGELKKISVR